MVTLNTSVKKFTNYNMSQNLYFVTCLYNLAVCIYNLLEFLLYSEILMSAY